MDDLKPCPQMTAYCNVCGGHKPASFRPGKCSETGMEYEDLCCETCGYIIATVTGRLLSMAVPSAAQQAEPVEGATEVELFKKWARPDSVQRRKIDDGSYSDHGMSAAFAGWMARAKLAAPPAPSESSDVKELVEALKAVRDAIKNEPAMQHSRFDQLGIQVNAALAKHGTQATTPKSALERYKLHMEGESEPNPIERLRFFLSLALTGQDWLDVEQFIDDLPSTPDLTAYGEKVREAAANMLEGNLAHTFGRHCAPSIRSMPLPKEKNDGPV